LPNFRIEQRGNLKTSKNCSYADRVINHFPDHFDLSFLFLTRKRSEWL